METDEWIVIGAMIFVALVGVFLVRLSLSRNTSSRFYVVLVSILLILGALGVVFYGLYENKEPIWWIIPTGVIGFIVIFLVLFIVFGRVPESDLKWRERIVNNSQFIGEIVQRREQLKYFSDDEIELLDAQTSARGANLVLVYDIFVKYLNENHGGSNPKKLEDEKIYEQAIIKGPEANRQGTPIYSSYEELEKATGYRNQKDRYRAAWEAALKNRNYANPEKHIRDETIEANRYIRDEMKRRGLESVYPNQ